MCPCVRLCVPVCARAQFCFGPSGWEPRLRGADSRVRLPRASISRDPFYDMLATRKRRIANKK